MALALSGMLLLGLVRIYSQGGRNPVDKLIRRGCCCCGAAGTWFYAGFAAQGAEGGGLGRSWSRSPRGVKSIRCGSCLRQLRLIRVVALINFTFGCAPITEQWALPWGRWDWAYFGGEISPPKPLSSCKPALFSAFPAARWVRNVLQRLRRGENNSLTTEIPRD